MKSGPLQCIRQFKSRQLVCKVANATQCQYTQCIKLSVFSVFGSLVTFMTCCDVLLYYVLQLPLPDGYVAERFGHSVSTLQLGPHCMWLILFGGRYCKADTVIIELSEY